MRQREELEVLMLSLHRGTKLCAAIVVAAIMLIGALSWSYAETGSVRLNIVKAGFIVGTYSQASAALAIVGGGRVAELQNANGVILKVKGPEVGLEASLSLSGMTISMQQ